MSTHQPLHLLEPGPVRTAGRAAFDEDGSKLITNAHVATTVRAEGAWEVGALVRVTGRYDGETIVAETITAVSSGRRPQLARDGRLGEVLQARSELRTTLRSWFDARHFTETPTQGLVDAPGTDVDLDPIPVELRHHPSERSTRAYLHTSPEFAMKRLLAAGLERIYYLGKVWRNGEVSRHHNPEFTMLEWYRAWEPVDTIVDDVEAIVRACLPEEFTAHGPHGSVDVRLKKPIPRMTMQEVIDEACGFDILEHLETESLRARLHDGGWVRGAPDDAGWSDLFSELQVNVLDPWIARKRALFVTHWPTPVAVLARRDPADPRQSERFELYLGGVELANGFGELTDPVEQRERFNEEDRDCFARRLPRLPIPERFLGALRDGMPPSAGVALGVDRLLMLALEARELREVLPFAITSEGGRWSFG